jgi:hypothetical protein
MNDWSILDFKTYILLERNVFETTAILFPHQNLLP